MFCFLLLLLGYLFIYFKLSCCLLFFLEDDGVAPEEDVSEEPIKLYSNGKKKFRSLQNVAHLPSIHLSPFSPHLTCMFSFFFFFFDCGRKTGQPGRMHSDARRTCKSHPKKGQTKLHVFAQVLQKNPTTVYEPIKKNKDPATAGQSKQKLAKEDC